MPLSKYSPLEEIWIMSVAKVIEITSTSTKSFEDAIEKGITKADKTLHNIEGAWIKEQKVEVTNGKIDAYRVNMLVTFILDENTN
jgi:flavin-binding protein dodecin